jgi:hypothetical protein
MAGRISPTPDSPNGTIATANFGSRLSDGMSTIQRWAWTIGF